MRKDEHMGIYPKSQIKISRPRLSSAQSWGEVKDLYCQIIFIAESLLWKGGKSQLHTLTYLYSWRRIAIRNLHDPIVDGKTQLSIDYVCFMWHLERGSRDNLFVS